MSEKNSYSVVMLLLKIFANNQQLRLSLEILLWHKIILIKIKNFRIFSKQIPSPGKKSLNFYS